MHNRATNYVKSIITLISLISGQQKQNDMFNITLNS